MYKLEGNKYNATELPVLWPKMNAGWKIEAAGSSTKELKNSMNAIK